MEKRNLTCSNTPPESFNVGQSLMIASNLMKRRMDHEVFRLTEDDSISGANAQIIGFLAAHLDQEVYQKDIEKEFSLRPSTVSANLRLMEKKGFVTRAYSTVDTRLKRVIPTDKALQLNSAICEMGYRLEEEYREVLTKEEQDTMIRLLGKLIRAFQQAE